MFQEGLLVSLLLNDKCVKSSYLVHSLGVVAVLRAFLSKYSMYKLVTMELTRDPIATPSTCSWNWPWKEKYVLCRQNPNKSIMFCTDNTFLLHNEVSWPSMPCMILSAGSTSTDLNSAVTSYEQGHSPGWRVTLLNLSTNSLVLCTWCNDFPTKGFKYLSKDFGYLIGDWTPARYYGPEEGISFMDLWKSVKLGGSTSHGIHVLVDLVI